jgi:hypothetical protein
MDTLNRSRNNDYEHRTPDGYSNRKIKTNPAIAFGILF